MTLMKDLISQLKSKLSNQFIRNFGWLGISEVTLRIVRLVFTVILARFLTTEDYGLAAIVLAVGEFTRIFMDVGIWWKIIQSDKQDLEEICNSSYWLNWVVYTGIFFIQCLLSFPISWFYQNNNLILPICVTAIPYLIAPTSAIHYALLHRENQLKTVAIIQTISNSTNYILGALLALLGFGFWSIVLPGVLFYPINCFIQIKCYPWRPTTGFTTARWKEIWAFGKNTLGVQLLKVLRNNLDYLIVGRFIGIKELGLYFFGFNAGLGISLSVINALTSALLPHLCEARPDKVEFKKRYFSSTKIIALIIIPLVLLQTSLAPFYVPIIFGQKWIIAIPVLMLICLSAIPRPFADAASQLLVAVGKPDLDLRWNIMFTAMFTGALFIGVQWQAIGVATSVLLVHVIGLPLFTFWATRYVFHRS